MERHQEAARTGLADGEGGLWCYVLGQTQGQAFAFYQASEHDPEEAATVRRQDVPRRLRSLAALALGPFSEDAWRRYPRGTGRPGPAAAPLLVRLLLDARYLRCLGLGYRLDLKTTSEDTGTGSSGGGRGPGPAPEKPLAAALGGPGGGRERGVDAARGTPGGGGRVGRERGVDAARGTPGGGGRVGREHGVDAARGTPGGGTAPSPAGCPP
eukprot:g75338.t1